MDTIEKLNAPGKPKLASLFAEIDILCDQMSDEQCDRARDILEQLTNRWALRSLSELAQSDAALRFSELQRRLEGVSQKVLTQTLRMLESNGLITRTVHAEVPPRVCYALTDTGRELLGETLGLWIWVARRLPEFQRSRT